MKYKLLSVRKNNKVKAINIGDYIQALASSQYYSHVDGFLDRDEDLNSYDEEPCKMIMNGWYMHNPQNWPPTGKIIPLFVAFHLNVLVREELTSSISVNYLKKHQPIGCRDTNTVDILTSAGIKAYFSGCMTLTLGKKYHNEEKDHTTYIVDPILSVDYGLNNIYQALRVIVRHPLDIINLLKKDGLHLHDGKNKLKKIVKTALYYKVYSKMFSKDIIMNSTYIHHYVENKNDDFYLLDKAEQLVKLYAKARLVITSRIHCALPCLGLETPVIYLREKADDYISTCRLGGIEDLFNMVEINDGDLQSNFKIDSVISSENYPVNKDSWKVYAQELDKRCKNFISE